MASGSDLQKMLQCGRVFCPAAPIDRIQLFRGRKEQLQSVISAITTRGKHVVMFGDRGVGKTSLANILKDALHGQDSIEVAKINCNENDSYLDSWRRALAEITMLVEGANEKDGSSPTEYVLSQWLEGLPKVGSGEIKKILNHKCSEAHDLVIIFDEVDRLGIEQRRLFADTIKDLSDSSTHATIMLIGVAHTITDLIEEHKSIERCIAQIWMPPMAKYELREIIDTGLRSLGMTIDRVAKDIIVSLSRGYPYYTHLLCNEAINKAIRNKARSVEKSDLNGAIKQSIANAVASVQEDYSKAADGQRKGTKYPIVLLASALADTDDLGYFRPFDLKAHKQAEGEKRLAQDYSEHLNKLATDPTRGNVLERRGTARKYKFRFRNPLLKPYIIMKGIDEGLVGGGLLEGLSQEKKPPTTLFDDFA